MANLPPWVIFSLRERCTPAELVARARALSVSAEETRDGIALPGGFLATIVDAPFPSASLDRSLLEGAVAPGPAQLLVSGGTNDLARAEHQQPVAVRRAARAQVEAILGAGDANATIESGASRKVRSLTRLAVDLAPLATLVVLPRANHQAFVADELRARATEYLDETGYHFPLWTYLKVRDDADRASVETSGMWIFGLPDVAMAIGEGRSAAEVAPILGSVQRELVAEGTWPVDGDTFDTPAGRVVFTRHWDGLWLAFAGAPEHPLDRVARRRFARRRAMMCILGDHTLHHVGAEADGIAFEHFLRPGANGIALTNGLSDRPQRGALAEDENVHVEIALTSPELGPWANGFVHWILQCLALADATHPIRPRDRMVLPKPVGDIAGAILWPMGHLRAERAEDAAVHLWDMIPFTPAELTHFRSAPLAQREWMDAQVDAGAIPSLLARWRRPAG